MRVAVLMQATLALPVVTTAQAEHLAIQQPINPSPLANYAEPFGAEFAPLLATVTVTGPSFFDNYKDSRARSLHSPYLLGRFVGLGLLNLTSQDWQTMAQLGLLATDNSQHVAAIEHNNQPDQINRDAVPLPARFSGLLIYADSMVFADTIALKPREPTVNYQEFPYLISVFRGDYRQHYQRFFSHYRLMQASQDQFGQPYGLLITEPDVAAEIQNHLQHGHSVVATHKFGYTLPTGLFDPDDVGQWAHRLDVVLTTVDIDGVNGPDMLRAIVVPSDANGAELNAIYDRNREFILAIRFGGQWWITNYINFCGQADESCGW